LQICFVKLEEVVKIIAIFNNKGGVGKTTLTYHTACALAELGHRTLLVDLDPQSNLTLFGVSVDDLYQVWLAEDPFVEDFDRARKSISPKEFLKLLGHPRSVHFLLKPTEDGTAELGQLAHPVALGQNLDLIPGRLTVHMYENKIAARWSEAYQGDPLALRTITQIRHLCAEYADKRGYEFVLFDTSPSLGILNKVIISTADAFVVPCMPDMFSLYGIKNIGTALTTWKKEFDTMYTLLSDQKRQYFPEHFVRFIGFTIFNAKRYTGTTNSWNLATAHYNYAKQIPETITEHIAEELRSTLPLQTILEPIGGTAVMHSHSTLPNMAQKYRCPIWKVPDCGDIESEDKSTISGNRSRYEATKDGYHAFAKDLLARLQALG
jgi:cellulose biosynthesis protein BcsQ